MIPARKTRRLRSALPLVLLALLGGGSLQAQSPVPAAAPASTPLQEEKAKQDAQVAADAWLKLLDSGKYAETWQTGSVLFQKSITQDGWVTLLKGGVPVFGTVETRKLKIASFSRIVPGAPDGQYVVFSYDTDFANTKTATEIVATALDADGKWRVIGYHIK